MSIKGRLIKLIKMIEIAKLKKHVKYNTVDERKLLQVK